jgi:putative transposase
MWQYINRSYRRSGTLWEGRYRSCPTQAETYLFACQRYIELNPVHANIVSHPAEYHWSSYRSNAQGEVNALIEPHVLYHALGADAESRQAAYRELFRDELNIGLVDEIRRATSSNYTLGNDAFAMQISEASGLSRLGKCKCVVHFSFGVGRLRYLCVYCDKLAINTAATESSCTRLNRLSKRS